MAINKHITLDQLETTLTRVKQELNRKADNSTFSNSANGLTPKSDGSTTKYLRADGTWSIPPDTNTTYNTMTAATSSTAGKAGLVPAPAAGKQAQFLRGDGTWQTPTDTTYSAATTSANGLMTAAMVTKLNGIADGANKYTYTLPEATSSILGGVKIGSNITVSSGTISLTKSNVTTALGYTPPTSDTNTTYSFATGDNNGTIKVTPSGGTASNISVKGLGSAAYAATSDFAPASHVNTTHLTIGTTSSTAAAGNHTHSYAGSSSAGGAATSANKVNSSLSIQLNGGTATTFDGSAAKSINITPSAIGAAASHSHPYLSTSGGTVTGDITISKSGARVTASNDTNSIWFGINTDGTKMGIYDPKGGSGAGQYVLSIVPGEGDSGVRLNGTADYADKLTNLTISSSAPSSPSTGDIWIDI